MSKRLLIRLNLFLVLVAACLILCGSYFYFIRPSKILPVPVVKEQLAVPKGAFIQPQEAYGKIGPPALQLHRAPITPKLPDLRKLLVYYGKNGRPDAKLESTQLHFSFLGNKALSSVLPGEKLYLYYDRLLTPPQYVFSPSNKKTCLWIEPALMENGSSLIKVGMCGENGEEMPAEPFEYAQFSLPEKEILRMGNNSWEIGKYRVDGTLLARQKARWFGVDKFLERHGGKEYADFIGKQRIDFGEENDIYSVFVNVGDALVWDNNRWNVIQPGKDSLQKPLLIIKKIDDRLMNFELWDPEGKNKLQLNLLKSIENWAPQNLQKQFKFLGSRTRSQFVFEINKERVFLSPRDWLLSIDGSWKKLITPDEIDRYVNRNTIGPLFVFDGIVKVDNREMLSGVIFSPSRTEVSEIQIPMQQSASAVTPTRELNKAKPNAQHKMRPFPRMDDDEDDNEDDFEDDDDE